MAGRTEIRRASGPDQSVLNGDCCRDDEKGSEGDDDPGGEHMLSGRSANDDGRRIEPGEPLQKSRINL